MRRLPAELRLEYLVSGIRFLVLSGIRLSGKLISGTSLTAYLDTGSKQASAAIVGHNSVADLGEQPINTETCSK